MSHYAPIGRENNKFSFHSINSHFLSSPRWSDRIELDARLAKNICPSCLPQTRRHLYNCCGESKNERILSIPNANSLRIVCLIGARCAMRYRRSKTVPITTSAASVLPERAPHARAHTHERFSSQFTISRSRLIARVARCGGKIKLCLHISNSLSFLFLPPRLALSPLFAAQYLFGRFDSSASHSDALTSSILPAIFMIAEKLVNAQCTKFLIVLCIQCFRFVAVFAARILMLRHFQTNRAAIYINPHYLPSHMRPLQLDAGKRKERQVKGGEGNSKN